MKTVILKAIVSLFFLFSISAAVVVEGVVTDAVSHFPIEQVQVSIDSNHYTFTDVNGRFSIKYNKTDLGETEPHYLTLSENSHVTFVRMLPDGDESLSIQMQNSAQLEQTNMKGDSVMTPFGYRHKRGLHIIGGGHTVDHSNGRIREFDESGKYIRDHGFYSENGARLPQTTQWISCAYWTNNRGYTTSFTTSWVVPPNPRYESQQIIYLFNGIEDNNGTVIIQPVLGWISGAWYVASWYVYNGGNNFDRSQFIQVTPGTILTGRITGTGTYKYSCRFDGAAFNNTLINEPNTPLLVWHCQTLEAYESTGNYPPVWTNNYPGTIGTLFYNISIATSTGTPAVNWAVWNIVTGFGQKTTIVRNTNPNGQVFIYYRDPTNPNIWYRIVNMYNGSNYVLDADNTGGLHDGSNVQVYQYGGGSNQQWGIRDAGNGYYYIVNRANPSLGLDADVSQGPVGDWTNVHLWTYWGGNNQIWQIGFDQYCYGACKILSKANTTYCVDASLRDGWHIGSNVITFTYAYNPNQRWRFEIVEGGTP